MTRLNRRRFLAHGALMAWFAAAGSLATRAAAAAVPWRNWSGNLVAWPRARFAARDEDDLVRFLRSTTGILRPVGSGHSFAPLVPTTGDLVVIDRLRGLIAHDAGRLTATFAGGTTLAETGPLLAAVGQGMVNLPDVDRQTIAGAIATATHGTGLQLPCLSAQVQSLRLVTPAGEILDLDAGADPDLLAAARVHLGALGVITRVTMQNRASYHLRQRSWVERTDDILGRFDQQVAAHRHFEIFPLAHSDYAIALATDEVPAAGSEAPVPQGEESAFDYLASLLDTPPAGRRPLIDAMARQIGPEERTDVSYRILASVRALRFNEMEYSVPLAAGADCLREILRVISDRQVDVVAPLEFRYVAGDSAWLSMNTGGAARAAISIHRVGSRDYRPYFERIEPIFRKYGGRPHWGKIHSLGATELRGLYPEFERFLDVRARLDPRGRLLNEHLAGLFGIRA